MSRTLYCTVDFSFSKEVDEKTKERMQKEFIDLRSIAVNLLNPQYDRWNKEYADTRKKLPKEDLAAYNKFIQGKDREVLKYVNDAYCKDKITYLDADEDADICGRLMEDPDVIMHMTIKPMDIGEEFS